MPILSNTFETTPEYLGLSMSVDLANLINITLHPLSQSRYRDACRTKLDENGVLVLSDFLSKPTIDSIREDGVANQHHAFYTSSSHNVYLKPHSEDYPDDHPRNRSVTSSKGCITTDQIPQASKLHELYGSDEFKEFLCAVLDEDALYEYADSLSSINLHYAADSQELGWHFDNSSFAITLLIQEPLAGGQFEYVRDARNADAGDMNYTTAAGVLDGDIPVQKLDISAGDLVLFRGRDSMHRVTPTVGEQCRMLVVLAYNSMPDIELSESARMTFYGRLGESTASS